MVQEGPQSYPAIAQYTPISWAQSDFCENKKTSASARKSETPSPNSAFDKKLTKPPKNLPTK